MFERQPGQRVSLGTYCTISSPEIVEVIGNAGFDHIILDQMFAPLDWSITAHLIRAAQLAGMAPIVRIQTYPWGSRGEDFRIGAEVARALGSGAAGAMASVYSIEEIEACLEVQRDASHGRIWLTPDSGDSSGRATSALQHTHPFIVVPLLEVMHLLDDIEAVVSLDGLRAIALGIHDICEAVGHPLEVDHPLVWEIVDRVEAAAQPRGIDVWVNVGYKFSEVEDITARIGRLVDHGITTIQAQGAETMVHHVFRGIRVGADKLG
jgi:2-keto-3-deoxy-L-rhamnonate aldolase RhmA